MTVGNPPTVAAINQALTNYAVQMRDLMQNIANLNMQIAQLGQAGLESATLCPPGYDTADAPVVVSQAAILNTLAAVYFGTATQATEYNFNNALCGLWAGQ